MRDGGKQKVEIAPRNRRTILAAGMFETSKTLDTSEPVETFTMPTTEPTDFLGTVHDRAPLIMRAAHYEAWIAGDAAQTQALIGVQPGADDFEFSWSSKRRQSRGPNMNLITMSMEKPQKNSSVA